MASAQIMPKDVLSSSIFAVVEEEFSFVVFHIRIGKTNESKALSENDF